VQPPRRSRIVHSEVLSRVLDGEAIVIDLRNGCYYAMPGSGAVIWSRLAGGATIEESVDAVARHFGVAAEDVRADVSAFLASLEAAGLIAAEEAAGEAGAPKRADAADGLPDLAPGPYRPARLETYTDLQDFLLVDPIHEVDERGWPPAPEREKSRSS
jgi:hypothetical protein